MTPAPPVRGTGGTAIQLFMSAGTLVLGLLLALVLASGPNAGEFVLLGWVLAGLGALGVALHVLLGPRSRSGRPGR